MEGIRKACAELTEENEAILLDEFYNESTDSVLYENFLAMMLTRETAQKNVGKLKVCVSHCAHKLISTARISIQTYLQMYMFLHHLFIISGIWTEHHKSNQSIAKCWQKGENRA